MTKNSIFLRCAFTGCEVVNYMKEGMIEDWDTFEKVLDYSYDKCIKSEAQYHPVLFSEATVCTLVLYIVFDNIRESIILLI